MKLQSLLFYIFLSLTLCYSGVAFSQPTWTYDPFGKSKKPVEYEDRLLGSEKTATKKFTWLRRFTQNNITHYNFYYNAKNKINGVIENARENNTDDFTKLLPYYPINLDNTVTQNVELDSVVDKSTTAILIHDLRSDWVDDMYMLIGRSYFYRKLFDSAALTFQFINYNLFPRKKKDADDRIIGENNRSASSFLSIADAEKRNIIQKILTLPPVRNEALIWLVRTFIEQEEYGDAAGMIEILQHDPKLPKRLKAFLNDVTGYWYYKQKMYDSAAVYLEKGLPNYENKQDRSRQLFLLGQLYEMSGNLSKSSSYYSIAAHKTNDALLDIYANLNNAKMYKNNGDQKELDKSIDNLLRMSKKDKFESYRDIIFHSAAMLSLKKNDTINCIAYLNKSLHFNENNAIYKNKAHLQLGKISYDQKLYKDAADHYDSIDVNYLDANEDSSQVANRKTTLRSVSNELSKIQYEDSLQMIAAMSPEERDLFIKKLVKKYKKEKGEAVDEITSTNYLNSTNSSGVVDLFVNNSKGEWYFYNASSKSRGYNEFKSKWGKRENVDNWRRKVSMNAITSNLGGDKDPMSPDAVALSVGKPLENSYDALIQNVPLSEDLMNQSKHKVVQSLIHLAQLFELELRDYQQAINTYDIYLQRFPDSLQEGQIYLGLYHCYTKLGNASQATFYKNLLDSKFASSKYAKILNDPTSLQPEKNNPVFEKKYQEIYDLFIEGLYDSAIALKEKADCELGDHYWTPQLLYIWAIYSIKCTSDSEAILMLENIVNNYPTSLLSKKAQTLINVLNRRAEIEKYLSDLQVERVSEEDRILMPDEKNVQLKKSNDGTIKVPQKMDLSHAPIFNEAAVQMPPAFVNGPYKWYPSKKHLVVMLLDKVDGVYVNEAKNAFTRYNKQFKFDSVVISKDLIDAQRSLLVFADFEDAAAAMVYFEAIKKSASSEISWLSSNKYSFFVISEQNLQLLKSSKDLDAYKQLLKNVYPGKF